MSSRVVIAGGGVAGLEAALALRALAGERCEIELYSPQRDFYYRPYAVGQPFELAEIERRDLAELTGKIGVGFHLDGIAAVDPEAGRAETAGGETLDFDYLIVASGAVPSPAVPGAITFAGERGGEVEEVIDRFLRGEIDSLAFAAPTNESWDLPIYELALIADSRLPAELKPTARLVLVTAEEVPLRIFGRAVSEAVAELLDERGIEKVPATHPVEFDGARLHTIPDREIDVDAVIALPRLRGRSIEGLPCDESGFIPIDDHCRVARLDNVFAAGDVTSFPVKQGGIATQHADVAASAIAAELGLPIEPEVFDPILRAVLWTGEGELYLEGWLRGGHGESSLATTTRPWRGDESKIVGRYLMPFLAELR